jgi:hypothetical protein
MKTILALSLLCFLPFINLSAQVGEAPEGEIITTQTFDAEFPHFGKVKFASYKGTGNVNRFNFYFLKGGVIEYQFADFYGNKQGWMADEIVAVAFKDLNNDNLKDVIIIANYMTGIGPDAAVPFPVIGVYINKTEYFDHYDALNSDINSDLSIKSVADVVKYFKEKKITQQPVGELIPNQTFDVELPHFGKVKFASYADNSEKPVFKPRLYFYLMKDNQIVYAFPEFYGHEDGFDCGFVKAVGLRDVNDDGLKDIIIIGECLASKPFPVIDVYFNATDRFTHDKKINEALNSDESIKTIADIVNYFKNQR